jgi:hypothetical protein
MELIMKEKTIQIFCDFALDTIQELPEVYDEFYEYAITDVNSSRLREDLTSFVCGYKSISGKLGYDAVDSVTNQYKEIKPKLFTGKSTNGGGNFTDMTMLRLEKMKNDNINVITSFFSYGKLIYILEFPFECIYDRLYEQIYEKCVVKKNSYTRSASFTYKHYIDNPKLQVKYINWNLVDKYNGIISKPLKEKLKLLKSQTI